MTDRQVTPGLLAAALRYASRGRRVIPIWWVENGTCACPLGDACRSPAKHPLTIHGVQNASASEHQIPDWWQRWPRANVAIATGSRSGFIVIDIDPRHGGDDSLAECQSQLGALPETISVLTQTKGRHLYFEAPATPVRNSAGTLGLGIDVRGEDGYVIAPPSIGVAGEYVWDTLSGDPEGTLAQLPERWLEKLTAHGGQPNRHVDGPIPEGRRNTTLASLAGSLHHRGLPTEVILRAIHAVNGQQCHPPLPASEVDALVHSIVRYPIPPNSGIANRPEAVIVAGALRLKSGQWVTPTTIELHAERDGKTVFVDRLSPGSFVSRNKFIATLRDIDPSIDAPELGLQLCALSERKPPHGRSGNDALQGQAVVIEAVEPSPDPVDGGRLLQALVDEIHKFMVVKPAAAVVIVLWLVAAHSFGSFDIFPRLVIRSPTKRCGKSRLLDLLGALLANALMCVNLTVASLFRVVHEQHPVLLLDETDRFLKNYPELTGLLNAGHKRGATVMRCAGDDSEVRRFDVFSPAALAGIGDQADTLMDRSHVITLQRRVKGETVSPLRAREQREIRARMLPQILRWVADHARELEGAEPVVPESLDDRAADNAAPLLAVADLAGGEWPVRARTAITQLSGARQESDDGKALMLLRDLREMFDSRGVSSLPTMSILKLLHDREDRPWSEYGRAGKPIGGWHVGDLLGEFGVKSDFVVDPDTGKKVRGYQRIDLETPWSRYLPADPLRDSVPSADPLANTAENDETGLRSTAPQERSADWPAEPQDELEPANATESRSGARELSSPHVHDGVAPGPLHPAHPSPNGRSGIVPRRRRPGLDAGDVCCAAGGLEPAW